jgi:hypothetical protein
MNLIDLISQAKQHTSVLQDLESSERDYQAARGELDKLYKELSKFSKYDISSSIDKIPYSYLGKLLTDNLLTPTARKKALKLIHPAQRESAKFAECPVCFDWMTVIITECNHSLCQRCFKKIKNGNILKCPMCRTINNLRAV